MPPSSILHGTIIGEVFCSNLHKSEVHLFFFSVTVRFQCLMMIVD
jgi:hypothetical protein